MAASASMACGEESTRKLDEESPPLVADNAEFALTVLHEVVRLIMQHLPAQTLNTCARVCRCWRDVARKVKKSRQKHMWLMHQGDKPDADIHEEFGAKIPELSGEPSSALLLCTYTLYEKTVSVPSKSFADSSRCPRAAKQEKVKAVDYMLRSLPSSCQITGIVADGIVGTSTDSKVVREMEGLPGASCVMFPKMDGIDIYTFFTGTHLEEMIQGVCTTNGVEDECRPPDHPTPESDRALRAITGIPEGKEPRVVLLFHTEHFYYINADIGYALMNHYDKVVVAGGYVDNLLPEDDEDQDSDSESDETILMGMAFCGDNIKMASVVLRSDVQTRNDVENSLKKLKNTKIPEDENSIGFMFACIGRGQGYYNREQNVEADAFHKLFPKVPLFGFFGNGEVGFDYLPDYSKPDSEQDNAQLSHYKAQDLPEIHHSYTTIFVLMSMGKKS